MAKELYADLVKQEWIGDLASEVGREEVRVDGYLMSRFNAAELKQLVHDVNHGVELDNIAYELDLVGPEEGQHSGPFEVRITPWDLEEFLESIGIDDPDTLTDESLAQARERYLRDTNAPPGPKA